MTAVFVSHSNAGPDRPVAIALRDGLLAAGYENVFLDVSGLRAMAEWEAQLYRQLAVADVVVFLHSSASATSPWCQREIGIARYRHLPVLVIPIEDVGPLEGLSTVQQLGYQPDPNTRANEALVALRRGGFAPEDEFAWDVDACPYPGLAPLDMDRAAVFFGREQEVRELESHLDPERTGGAVVLVAGASGTGKSSLVRAGLLPRLVRRPSWEVLGVLEPGRALRSDLAAALDRLAHRPSSPEEAAGPTPLLVIDQAERLLVVGSQPGLAALDDLAAALGSVLGLHAILVTKSVDARLTTPVADWMVAKHLVVGLGRAELARVIAEPAARSGVDVEPALVSRLVEETPSGEALPLLAFTLAEIWRERVSPTAMTFRDYQAVGGVTRALNDAARSVMAALPLQSDDDVVSTMLEFVSVDPSGQPISVPRSVDSFAGGRRAVVDAFVERRLLTLHASSEGTPSVALTHDALMSSWGALASAIEREREGLVLETDVRREAARGEEDWTLVAGPRLDAALRRFHGREPEEEVRRYLAACREAEEAARATRRRTEQLARQRRRWTAVATAGLAATLVAAVVVVFLLRQNTRIDALQRAAQAVGLVDSRTDAAITDALAAVDAYPGVETYSALLTVLSHQPGTRRYLTAAGSDVRSVAMTPDGSPVIGTGRGLEDLVEATGELAPRPADVGEATAVAVVGSRDPITVVANRTRVTMIDEAGPRRLGSGSEVLAVSDDGARIAVTDGDSTIRLLDSSGATIGSWQRPQTVHALALSGDGSRLAAVELGGSVVLADTAGGTPTEVESSISQLASVAMSSDAGFVVVMSSDGEVERLELAGDRSRVPLDVPGQATTIALLGDSVLAAGLEDGRIALFEPMSGNRIATVGAHGRAVAAIAGEADRFVSADTTGETILWDGADAVPRLADVVGKGLSVTDVDGDGVTVGFGDDRQLSVWQPTVDGPPESEAELTESHLEVADDAVDTVAIGSAGRVAYHTHQDGKLEVFANGIGSEPTASLTNTDIGALEWTTGGLVAGTSSGELLVVGGTEHKTEEVAAGITVLQAISDTSVAWGTSDGRVGLWDFSTEEPPQELGRGHGENSVTSLGFEEDRRVLYSGGDDHRVLAWELGSTSPSKATEVAAHGDAVVGVVPVSTADERWLVTVSQDYTLQIWDLETRSRVGPSLRAPSGGRYTWAGAGAGGEVVTLDDLGRVIIWRLSTDDLIRTACDTLLPDPSARPSSCPTT